MKVAAIIAEYNPFHKGHEYHILKTKEELGVNKVIIIMSGCFTQRGIPSIIDKYTKAKMALLNGADLVLELPTVYATSSAEYFAKGAVEIAERIGVCDYLSFGSESANLKALTSIASILANESDIFSEKLKELLKQGTSFPVARAKAVTHVAKDIDINIINSPNNLLGIEYIKALIKMHSNIEPYTILRNTSSHNDLSLDNEIASSAAIRAALNVDNINMLSKTMPLSAHQLMLDELVSKGAFLCRNDFSSYLHLRLLEEASEGFTTFFDISRELSDRIINKLPLYENYEQFIDLLKTKEVTHSRISRALLHILLNIKSEEVTPVSYANVLGFKKESQDVLSAIKKKSCIPLITKPSNYNSLLEKNPLAINMFEKDIHSYQIYQSALLSKTGIIQTNPLKISPVII